MASIDSDRFNCTFGERAAFEAGIKLASLYHQFIGTPVGEKNRVELETAMEGAMRMQPHVIDAKVTIDHDALIDSMGDMDYCSLNEKMIRAMVKIMVDRKECTARMEYLKEMDYPLMWIEEMV